ncbi:MAG: terpene synthase family protein, partial [Archangium sp.]
GVLGLVTIPPRLMDHPTIKRLNVMTNHVITIFNDLISLEKEMRVGDVHNLVLILQNEKKCSLEEAMQLTARMHDDEVRAFVELAGQLPSTWNDPEVKVAEVLPYIDVLQCWMRSNMDWSLFSERYHRLPAA